MVDGNESLTCAELVGHAQRLAGHFDSIGLSPGDVVSFQLPNWWEASVIDLACAMTGVVVNPIVPINRDAEVTYMLNESATRVMFIAGVFRNYDYAAMFARILPKLAHPPQVVQVRGGNSSFAKFDRILCEASPAPAREVDPNAVKLLLYTSGTTGRPKGVLHSHNTLHADSIKMKRAMSLSESDRIFCPTPVTHVGGYLWGLNMPWLGDMAVVMLDIWDPVRAFELLRQHDCAFMVGATPFLQDLVAVAKQSECTLDGLKYYMCGGASVPPKLIYDAANLFPNCIPYRIFGATEAPCITGPPATRGDIRAAAETDGRILHAEVKIVDLLSNEPLEPGLEGEILVREPSMALGYARLEDIQESYDDAGFFRMGDLGRIVDGDHLVCTGRKKDLIIRAGENISAKEIEDVLYRCDDIAEVAIVSMPSSKTGEAICAFIVPKGANAITLSDVSKMLSTAGVARQKTPAHVEIVAELPKTPSGKIRKDLLRSMAEAYRND
jgi:acyl-CoA synthetase (AMP-forming)/AMP-acid ligase II